MKKILALLLTLCLTVSMFGCGTITPEVNTTGTTGTTGTSGSTGTTTPTEFPSYSVSDAEAAERRDDVVATVNGQELTNAEFNVLYWMGIYSFLNNYSSYIPYYGLDLTLPLDQQSPSSEPTRSWQDFFVEDTLATWHVYMSTAMVAEEMGLQMSNYLKEDLDGLRDLMAESAEKGGYLSVDAMIQEGSGAASTADAYYNYTLHYYQYLSCMEYLSENTNPTEADIENYFTKHEEDLKESDITKESGNIFDVRHILITPEGGTTDEMTGITTYSDDEWEAARVKAQKLMEEWAGGTATEETFSNYAKEYSADPGSKDNGGLYQGLDKKTNFVEPFKNWYLEEGRKAGDYGLVKTDYGYHIMYQSTIEAKWIASCRNAIINETVDNFITDAQEKYPIETFDDKIAIGEVQLASES